MKKEYDSIIIGAGAAGLMCAMTAGSQGRRVLLLEGANKPGKKIIISGGGRCNFTNVGASPNNYLSSNPHFCKSALSRYTPEDFIELVEKHNIAYHEKKLGQLFSDHGSRDILQMLLSECKDADVEIESKVRIYEVKKTEEGYRVETNFGIFESSTLVIACGGLSFPKLGASGFGYQVAEQFGLKIISTEPGLVPLTLDNNLLEAFSEISGVSVDVRIRCGEVSFEEAILLTHKGLSGPAILQISSYHKKGDALEIDFLPNSQFKQLHEEWIKKRGNAELKNLLSDHIPKRLAHKLVELWGESKAIKQYNEKEIESLAKHLHRWTFIPAGTTGYSMAEVTTGGVDTNEISSKTFEAKKSPGLYFIGEVLDVTGWLGGYNFQWAWASGYCAGQYV